MIEFNNIMNDGCQLPPQMDDVIMIGGSPPPQGIIACIAKFIEYKNKLYMIQ